MTMNSKLLTLGYDLDMWRRYGVKLPISVDISPATNSHILVCGMSGSGKTFFEQIYKCAKIEPVKNKIKKQNKRQES